MSLTFDRICQLVRQQKVRVSAHGYDELANDGLTVDEVVSGASGGVVIEDYPDYIRELPFWYYSATETTRQIHVVWGIAKGTLEPAALVTAYSPDPARWSTDFARRNP